jgi:CheY-like chemotaxis protein
MLRPCFLVVDREFSGNISTRKLIIETAKFNVITAYSGTEAIETLLRFPAVDGIVIDAGLRDLPADEVIKKFKELQPKIPVVVIATPDTDDCPDADYHLEFFDPASLLELLQKLRPKETADIQAQNQALVREEKK